MTSSKRASHPTTTISYDIEHEARRILYLAAKLPTRAYQERGFLILPKLEPGLSKNTVIFPDLAYDSIPDFWFRTSRLELSTPITAPPALINETIDIVRPAWRENIYAKAHKRLLDQWQGIEERFWSNLFTLFPSYSGQVKQVFIYLTQSGSTTSFQLLRGDADTIHILARLDTPIDKILWSILTAIFRAKMQDSMNYSWSESQATIDWLIEESSLNCGVNLTTATITQIRNPQIAKWRQDSLEYQKKLGFSGTNLWTQKLDLIHYGSIKIDNLSHNEQLLLEVLLASYGKTVSNNEIMNHLWQDNYEISNWAITKQVQRLRTKLKSAGINHPVIQAHRGQGYSII